MARLVTQSRRSAGQTADREPGNRGVQLRPTASHRRGRPGVLRAIRSYLALCCQQPGAAVKAVSRITFGMGKHPRRTLTRARFAGPDSRNVRLPDSRSRTSCLGAVPSLQSAFFGNPFDLSTENWPTGGSQRCCDSVSSTSISSWNAATPNAITAARSRSSAGT